MKINLQVCKKCGKMFCYFPFDKGAKSIACDDCHLEGDCPFAKEKAEKGICEDCKK
jgi:hypothetical protein